MTFKAKSFNIGMGKNCEWFNYDVVKEQQLVADLPNNIHSIRLPPKRLVFLLLARKQLLRFFRCCTYLLTRFRWMLRLSGELNMNWYDARQLFFKLLSPLTQIHVISSSKKNFAYNQLVIVLKLRDSICAKQHCFSRIYNSSECFVMMS